MKGFFKRFLPARAWATLREAFGRIDNWLSGLGGRNRLLTHVYYTLFNTAFHREQRAVLAGRLAYRARSGTGRHSSVLLRRNTHRLEKALIMRPRREVFAESYIEETVAAFAAQLRGPEADRGELCWAGDVLSSYFAAVGETATTRRARTDFDQAKADAGLSGPGGGQVPFARRDGERSGVSFDEFLALCRQRRSVRWFLPEPVPRELVENAAAAAAQAPSACNRQPFLFRYFDEPGEATRIASIAMGTAGFADNFPALVVVLGDMSCYPFEQDRHVIYIDGALAAMQFMLALETLGLASCPINWPDIEPFERQMDAALELPVHIRPVMLIALGYPDPDGGVPRSVKRPVQALLRDANHYPD